MDTAAIGDGVSEARKALSGHEFKRAVELWNRAAESGPLGPMDEHLRATTTWLLGATASDIVDPLERAFEGYMAAGDPAHAAIVALDLVRFNAEMLQGATAKAWMKRAVSLVQDQPESTGHGWVAFFEAMFARMASDLDGALDRATVALEVARRAGDRDLEVLALNSQGRTLIRQGKVKEGRELLDEAMSSVVAGELSGIWTGAVYCSTIDGCTDVSDYARASEWTDAARRWCARKAIKGFPGICRVHQAEIERLRGQWARAEADALQAIEELEGQSMLHVAGAAYSELGMIKYCLGDLDAAEKAYRQTTSIGRDPQPGQALLRLAQGKTPAAASAIRRSLDDVKEPLKRIRLLPAAVRILLAAGADAGGEVEPLVREIEEISEAFDSTSFRVAASCWRGVLLLAQNKPREAAAKLRAAINGWTSLEAPYEAAVARLVLAQAYRAEDDEDGAIGEAEAARATFERLGAKLDAERARVFIQQGEVEAADKAVASGTAAQQTITFMFTDIVGSTSLLEIIGEAAWPTLLRWHDEALRAAFAAHGGDEIKYTGDGFHVAFASAEAGIACGIEIQRKLELHRQSQGFAPQVRIGVHSTVATRTGKDFAGKGVHEAARIAALAGGSEILVSAETGRAAPGVTMGEIRSEHLKGISHPVEVAPILWQKRDVR